MMLKTATSLAFATACLTAIATLPAQAQNAGSSMNNGPQTYSGTDVVTNGPQASQGDMAPSWSARRNVVESRQYDRLLERNPAFRQARMRKECGPISDPELRQSCFSSFNQDEPLTGSSTPRRSYRSEHGR